LIYTITPVHLQAITRSPLILPIYDLLSENGELNDQDRLVVMHTLKVVGIAAIFGSFVRSDGELARKRRWFQHCHLMACGLYWGQRTKNELLGSGLRPSCLQWRDKAYHPTSTPYVHQLHHLYKKKGQI